MKLEKNINVELKVHFFWSKKVLVIGKTLFLFHSQQTDGKGLRAIFFNLMEVVTYTWRRITMSIKYSRVWNKRSPLNKRSPWKICQKNKRSPIYTLYLYY